MPTYEFVNDETNEHYTVFCKYTELEQYLIDNPKCRKLISAPAIVGDHIVNRMDGGIKEVFSRIAEGHPNSPLADRFGDNRSIAKKKVESVGKRHGLVKDGSHIVPNLSNTYKTT
jgi:hypothetical protein